MGLHENLDRVEVNVDLDGVEMGICDNCDSELIAGQGEKVYCEECMKEAIANGKKESSEAIIMLADLLSISKTDREMHMTLEDEVVAKVQQMHDTLQKARDLILTARTLVTRIVDPM